MKHSVCVLVRATEDATLDDAAFFGPGAAAAVQSFRWAFPADVATGVAAAGASRRIQ